MCGCVFDPILKAVSEFLGQLGPVTAAAALLLLACYMALKFSFILGLLTTAITRRANKHRAQQPEPIVYTTWRHIREPRTSQLEEVKAVRNWVREGAKIYEPLGK